MQQNLLTNREIAVFTSQVELILHAGISPYEGIMIMNEDQDDEKMKVILTTIEDELSVGKPFYEALETSKVFPDYLLNMVKIGEIAGRLEEVMHSLSIHYQRLYETKQNIKSAIAYPIIMIMMMFVVVIVLMTQVLPIFNQVFIQLGSTMTGFSQMVLQLGMTLSTYSYVFIGILVVIIICVFYLLKSSRGKKRLYHILTRFYGARDITLKMALSQFTSAMSIALSSGLDIDQSLQMSKALVEHPALKKRIDQAESMLDQTDLVNALVKSQVLTGMYARLLKLGHQTGHVDTIMKNIADHYNEETNERIEHLISIIEPTLVIVLSLFVGIILLSVMLPLMGIMSSL